MKHFLALLLGFTFILFASVMVIDNDLIPTYGNANMKNSISDKFINKSVTGDTEVVKFGETSNSETGSANMVTSIVANYRSFDTLGEVTVLFISALGISLLAGTTNTMIERKKSGFILKAGSKVLMPILLVVGIYVITHGHLTPGGGFQGGSMIASSILLMLISDHEFVPNINKFKILEGLSGSVYIIIGLVGISATGYFLKNFMSTGVVGNLFSAGIIPVVYLFIGLKVGSELTSILTDFLKKEVNIWLTLQLLY